MHTEAKKSGVAPADPTQWSEGSQRSVSFGWTKEYHDIKYSCWRCQRGAVFSAEDQKYTFEVKKAPIDQRRTLCPDCWQSSLTIAKEINGCEERWVSSKASLSKDRAFLSRWLELLVSREEYVAYRPNTAAKNMLQKLLKELG
jgi:Probable zinc-ribbon domain